ncbi:MAG TPA: beta-propeller fold lactonase family protein [Terriglobales bacterium]|nr:beta-propeller fold lactonase family protein [Terriglobales bacterium]
MRPRRVSLLFAIVTISLSAQQKESLNLPTSKKLITPAPGDPRQLGSLPTNIVVSPDGRYAAILENGYGTRDTKFQQGIAVLNLETNVIQGFPDSRLSRNAKQSYFLGLAFSSDGRYLYAAMGSITDPEGKSSGDTGNGIAVYSFTEGKVAPERFIAISPQKLAAGKHAARISSHAPKGTAVPYPAGLAVLAIDSAEKLLVADNLSDDVLLIDAASGNIEKRFDVSTSEWVPASFPYAVVATKDGKRAWVSLWNASQVAELDLEKGTVTRWIKLHPPKVATDPGSHPTAMALSKDESTLFVALANTDEVAAVQTKDGSISLVSTRLPGQNAAGAYPNAVMLSSDGSRLFVANASSDAVAMFPVRSVARTSGSGQPGGAGAVQPNTKPLGFIPTEWYPTALAIHGDELLVVSGKAQGTGPNPPGGHATDPAHARHPYIATLLHGSIARIKVPEAEKNLSALTQEVLDSNLMNGRTEAIPFRSGKNPIRHVIYIIKENRTYDQILGDLGVGDGDPSLTMYGEDITPNQHKLARQFGVLDDFYDSGEVSGDGHVWSTAAITSDYTERTWQIAYRGYERTYDFEGTVANEYPIKQGIADVNEPGTGYLWTNMAKHGITYRHYGEYVSSHFCDRGGEADLPEEGTPLAPPEHCPQRVSKPGQPLPSGAGMAKGPPNPYQWDVPLLAENVATKPELRDHFDPNYPDFRLDFPDQLRADEFLREFNGWLDQRRTGKPDPMPQFIILRLPNDHTAGTRPGMPTPSGSVADNDLAVGRVVEAISHSEYWNDTAIFILEDDAQNGADHVDAHRSVVLVISKYSPGTVQKPFIDHNFYTTVNTIHTMEVLLGVPPMNNNDARAAIMAPLFTGAGNQPAFEADYGNQENDLIYQMNPPKGQGAKDSLKMDFSHADAVDTAKLNKILWRDRMGKRPMPKPQHNVIPESAKEDDD